MNSLNTPLNCFINTGLDERISKGYHMEQVTVHGKHGDYLAMRKKGTEKQPTTHQGRKPSHDSHGDKTARKHSNSKEFDVVGKNFMYMPISANGKICSLEQVVHQYHSQSEKKYSTLNAFIKANYFVSDGKTETADFYKVGGRYTPERVKTVHEPIIQQFLDKCPSPKSGAPVCFLYGGGSASGKSTVVNKVVTPMKSEIGEFGEVDADSIKAMLPEHEMFCKQDINMAAAREHEESSDLTNTIIDRLISDGRNFAYDGTMSKFSKYSDIIEKLSAKGYKIHIVAVDIPVDDALKRARARARKIPDHIVTGTHAAFSKNFTKIINAYGQDIDSFCLYDNSQPEGQEPTCIMSSEQGDDGEVVKNQALYERFMRKGGYKVGGAE